MMKWLNEIQRLDEVSFIWVSSQLRRTPRARIARWISRSGDGYCYIAICLLGVLSQWPDAYLLTGLLALGFVLELPVYWLLKNLLRRPRPYQRMSQAVATITASDQFSFPSGHTTAAFLFAGLSSSLLPQLTPYFYLWATAIGLSRVALGVHYLTDIAAGVVLGSLLVTLTLFIAGVWI